MMDNCCGTGKHLNIGSKRKDTDSIGTRLMPVLNCRRKLQTVH